MRSAPGTKHELGVLADMAEPSLFGVLFTMVFYAISVTPSVLPRRWWWHAFVSGVLMGLGYVLGWSLQEGGAALLRALDVSISAPESVTQTGTYLLVAAVTLWTMRSIWQSFWASKKAAALQEMKQVNLVEYLIGLAASFVMFAAVLTVVGLLRGIFNLIVSFLANWIYRPFALAIALVAVIALVLFISNRVVFRSVMAIFARKAAALNTTSADGYARPEVPERSGSTQSLVPWETIGGQGRKFIGKGPSAEMIEDVTGLPAMEPIRIYAGMPTADTNLDELADLAVADLERAGGFKRSLIMVNTATGSGWVDEWLVQPMEYLTRGNCAVVTMQYSYLFSAALMVSDLSVCVKAGTLLFEKVAQRVSALPEDERPLVIVGGESLGAYGSQDLFADAHDLTERVDGAIWTGSPQASKLLRQLTKSRHKGSPEVAPVFENGSHIRFVNNPEQLTRDRYGRELGPWLFPRAVFAQHASDPVVWFSSDLVFKEPDWIRERAGLDVPDMHFTPVATYLQLVADLPVAGTAPAGHGHTYHRELVDIWMSVLGFDGPVALGRLGETAWVTAQMKIDIGNAIEVDDQRDP